MIEKTKLIVVATTPLGVHFFLKNHLKLLSDQHDILLVLNMSIDVYTPPLDLPIRIESVCIKREISLWYDMLALIQLFFIFRRERPDVVWAVAPKAGLLGMIAAYVAGVKRRLFVFQGEVWASKTGFMRWILKFSDKLIASMATHLLAVSKSESIFLEVEDIAPTGKITVLGAGSICGVDMVRFKPDHDVRFRLREELSIPQKDVLILFVGRLKEDKGIYILADAFRRLAAQESNVWLCVLGPDEDDATSRVQSMLGQYSDRCRMVGFSQTPELYMAAADFLCLPSFREGFGMVISEAASAGLPAIGSRIYGISDAIVDGKTGLLVNAGDSNALFHAMYQLVNNTGLRVEMGQCAREFVSENLEATQVVARYVEYVENLLSHPHVAKSRLH